MSTDNWVDALTPNGGQGSGNNGARTYPKRMCKVSGLGLRIVHNAIKRDQIIARIVALPLARAGYNKDIQATPAVPRAGSTICPPIRGVPRLRQTFLPDFLYGGAMYRGEFLRELEEHCRAYDLMQMREFMPPPPRAFFRWYPDMNVQGPGPWSPQEVFGHAAAAAEYMGELWADGAALRELRENVHDNPDAFQQLITMSDMAFMSLLGPRATEYVRVEGADGGSLSFRVLPRGGLVPWGPGLDGFNAAVAADAAADAAAPAANAGSEHASEDASDVAGDAGAEDTADADTDTDATCLDDLFDAPTDSQSTSGTTAVTLSSHPSLPSLLDALTDDEDPRAAVYVLNPAQQRHLREFSQSGEEHEAASNIIQRWVMGVEPE
ncbi:hypothetical protein DFH09DRAFT_1085955 [Mycena vulgaris]|nr:hypothetical protein DFH09DRAFT_1085955 [Mycena vulgaris]